MGGATRRFGRELLGAATDFWPGFNLNGPLAHSILGPAIPDATNTGVGRADLVLYSVFGHRNLLARGTTVCFSGETVCAAANQADWMIDWRYLPVDNHLRLPPWAISLFGRNAVMLPTSINEDAGRSRFCAFVYSNPRCGIRNAFFQMLHEREPVDALGSVLHNADHPALSVRGDVNWRLSKIEALRDYRFVIAFENEEHPGYTTEKLTDVWAAGAVPIYWGDPAVEHDFPEDAYLSLYRAGSMRRLVEQVLEAHHDPSRYEALQQASPFRTGRIESIVAAKRKELDDFGRRVREDAERFRGRPRRNAPLRGYRLGRYAAKEARSLGSRAIH